MSTLCSNRQCGKLLSQNAYVFQYGGKEYCSILCLDIDQGAFTALAEGISKPERKDEPKKADK